MSSSASIALVKRAAAILAGGWYSCSALGRALYGAPKEGKSGHMSIVVRARRPVNKMLKLGMLAVRMNGVTPEYTLIPGGEEILKCLK